MPEIRPIQVCQASNGWTPVRVASGSQKGKSYLVLCNPWNEPEANICECKGYQNAGHCYHQKVAQSHLCWWREDAKFATEQTPHQRHARQCPDCGGPTVYDLIVTDKQGNPV